MNMYLVPVTEQCGYNYNYFILILADSPQNAYNNIISYFKTNFIKYRHVSEDICNYEFYQYNDRY